MNTQAEQKRASKQAQILAAAAEALRIYGENEMADKLSRMAEQIYNGDLKPS